MHAPRRLALLLSPLALALLGGPVAAQSLTGAYAGTSEAGAAVTLSLAEARGGVVTGTMAEDGIRWRVEGRLQGGGLVGTLSGPDGLLHFEADAWDGGLTLFLYRSDARGRPVRDDYRQVDLHAGGAGAPTPLPIGPTPAPGIGNPLAAGAIDPYVGTFSDGSVTLGLQGAAGRYQGQVRVGGRLYAVSATGGPSGLQGTLHSADGSYPMTIQAVDGGVYVVSGGQEYWLYADRAYARGGVAPQGTPWGTGRRGPARSVDDPLALDWTGFLEGGRLGRLSAGSGPYAGRLDVSLCSDRSLSVRADGTAGGGRAGGRWYVLGDGVAADLVLELDDGRLLEFRMERFEGSTYANGERVYLTPSEQCR